METKGIFGERILLILKEAMESGARIAQESFELGTKLTLDALERDGRIRTKVVDDDDEKPMNVGEEDYIAETIASLPEIIVARNEQMAEQIGDKINADLLKFVEGKA